MNRVFPVLRTLVCLIMCGLSSFCHAEEVTEGSSPVLVTPTLSGLPFDIASLKGKVVIVHFWATWCSSCREEMPVLDDFYLHHHAQGVEMIGVSMDSSHARDRVITYMRDFHFPASLMSDAQTNSFSVPSVLPITYILDRKGFVRVILTPDKAKFSEQILASLLLPLLKP